MKTIAAVLGDHWHPEAMSRASLEMAAKLLEEPVALAYYTYDELTAALEEKPDAVILFKENGIPQPGGSDYLWMTPDVEHKVTAYVEAGGGWLAWHSGLATYPTEGRYADMVKGYFVSHPDRHRTVAYKGLLAGWPLSMTFEDEQYFVRVREGETSVFLTSHSEDGESPAAWRHEYGHGRVCGLTPAHKEEGLKNLDFLRLLAQCIQLVY